MTSMSHLVSENVLRDLYYTHTYSKLNSTTHRIKSLTSRSIYSLTDQSNTNQLKFSPKFIQFQGVYEHFVPCKTFKIICER